MATAEPAPTAKRAAVQAAVLTATEDLLREGASYADLNIERIATRAGISRTAFYFYFRDKRELLVRLTGHVSEELYEQGDIWFSGEGDPDAEVRLALANIARVYRDHGVLLRAIVEVSTYDEDVAQYWRDVLGRFAAASLRRVEAGGVATDPQATAFALSWMTERALYQQFVQDDGPQLDELVEALAAIWLRAVYP